MNSKIEVKDEKSFPEPPRFRKAVYLSAIVAAVGGFICGYDTGSISGILAMDLFNARFFNQSNAEYLQGLLLAFFMMTAALGSFTSGALCDRLSRKYSIILASILFCIGVLFQLIGANFGLLLAGRLVGGFGSGLMGNAIPLYHSEIAPPDIRGRLISFFTLMSTFGQVVGYFVTFGTSYIQNDWQWRAPWLIQLIIIVLSGGWVFVLPFSPRWLIDKDRKQEALVVISNLHQVPQDHPVVVAEYESILSQIEFEHSIGNRTYVELFQKGNLKRTCTSFFIGISTAFTGINVIWYYSPSIFANAGLDDNSVSIATSGGSALLSFVASVISLVWFIDRWGRRTIFLVGAAAMGISMFIVGAMFQAFTYVDVDTYIVYLSNTSVRNTIIAFIYIFCAMFSFSWGIASYVYPAEVFNMRTRAKGVAMTYGLNWAFSILITYCLPLFLAHTVSGVFFFFGACCVVCFIGCVFIPETKGKTLEEMEYVFGAK